MGGTRLGQEATAVTLFFYYVSIYAHITKGLNRLVAVSSPAMYGRIFSRRNTFIFIGVGWTFSAAHNVPHHISKSWFATTGNPAETRSRVFRVYRAGMRMRKYIANFGLDFEAANSLWRHQRQVVLSEKTDY